MRHRSPARFLAPLALIVCVLAVYLIVKPASEDSPATSGTTATTTSSSASTTAKKPKPSKKQPKTVKTYTVQSGDTLSGIAEETGVPVEDLLQFNPGVDANSMRVGQKLKLAG